MHMHAQHTIHAFSFAHTKSGRDGMPSCIPRHCQRVSTTVSEVAHATRYNHLRQKKIARVVSATESVMDKVKYEVLYVM
jgi:hypothetical protein